MPLGVLERCGSDSGKSNPVVEDLVDILALIIIERPGIHVIFHRGMALRVQAVWPADNLVDKRVAGHIRGNVRQVAIDMGPLKFVGRIGFQGRGLQARVAVVQHIKSVPVRFRLIEKTRKTDPGRKQEFFCRRCASTNISILSTAGIGANPFLA